MQDENNGILGGERGNPEEEKRADGVTQEKETCPKQEAHVVYIKIWVLSTNRILSVMRHINHIV